MSCGSEVSVHPASARLWPFDRVRQFFDNWLARRLAIRELRRLRDRDLRDIGVERHDIAAAVEREIGRLQLDEFRSRG